MDESHVVRSASGRDASVRGLAENALTLSIETRTTLRAAASSKGQKALQRGVAQSVPYRLASALLP